jgi:regulatory protein
MRSPRKIRRLAEEELFEYAVRTLGARAWSTADLKARLRQKAADPSHPARIVDRLKEIGYLDDRRFAESYAANRVENQGFGRARILNDLRARRISPDLAGRAVEQAIGDKTEAEQIEAFIERRMGSLSLPGVLEDERKLAAAYRKLRHAGFSSAPVLSALKRRAKRPELLDEARPEEEAPDD